MVYLRQDNKILNGFIKIRILEINQIANVDNVEDLYSQLDKIT